MYAIVLSGGVGSRLWPISRKKYPKSFIKMPDGLNILQHTFIRALGAHVNGIVNVTNKEFLFKIKKDYEEVSNQLGKFLEPTYILEPFGKGTAAAIAMASLWVARKYNENELLLVLPSDHFILDQKAFNDVVKEASFLATNDEIVLFGIEPTSLETGYGYMKHIGNDVECFVEKPSIEKAKEFISSGGYLWNSGMFCFKAKTMLREMERNCSDILCDAKQCFMASKIDINEFQMNIDPNTFQKIRNDSIDYAIMEKSDKIAVVPCNIGWSDIGTWNAISKLFKEDAQGNVVKADAIVNEATNCYIESSSNRLIGAIGIDSLVIVDTPDALLVVHKDKAQDVKSIYNKLAQSNNPSHELHKVVYRPWGNYTVIEEGVDYKIKRVEINPQERLSLQSHQHRSEHWVVVQGNASIVNKDDNLLLSVGQSTYIPAGNKHRLSNLSNEKLVIIEVQIGSYLGEDDIIRFDDIYGRANDF